MKNITVIGAGAWGTALASLFVKAGNKVTLWAFEQSVVEAIDGDGINTPYLPDVSLPKQGLHVTGDLAASVENAEIIVIVTPTQFTRSTLEPLRDTLPSSIPLVIASKGIEIQTGELLSNVVRDIFPDNPLGILTGPTFAIEAAKELPTAITLAIDEKHKDIGMAIIQAIAYKSFRPYIQFDPIGAQIGSAVKNVIAIACGVSSGLDLGDNARAALITRGLAEITRLGLALGGKNETFCGLSGLGDLTLTCSAMQSRNFSLGYRIGKGEKPSDILNSRSSVSEGAYTAQAAVAMAQKNGVEMPICVAVDDMITEKRTAHEVLSDLMSRPLRHE